MSTNKGYRTLTSDMVLVKNPCDHYRALLITRYLLRPIEVTVALAVEQADDWDWYWAAENLLNNYDKFIGAVRDFNTKSRTIRAELHGLVDKFHGPAMDLRDAEFTKLRDGGMEYWDAMHKAEKVYDEHLKYARAARAAVNELISKERNKEMARLFAEQFIAEGNESPADESEDDGYCDCGACQNDRENED